MVCGVGGFEARVGSVSGRRAPLSARGRAIPAQRAGAAD